jgi:hypothetical protein
VRVLGIGPIVRSGNGRRGWQPWHYNRLSEHAGRAEHNARHGGSAK